MFNVAQTNNALLRSNLNRLELLYSDLQKKYSELETKYTSNTNILNQYMSAFTSNTIEAETQFTYTLPENGKWQKQSQYVSSVIIKDIHTIIDNASNSEPTETREQHLIFTLSSPMKYITESISTTASTKQIQSLVFLHTDLIFNESESIGGLIECKTFDNSNFEIFDAPTLYISKQNESTVKDKNTDTTITTTTYSIGKPEEIPYIVFTGNTAEYSAYCQCEFVNKTVYTPKLKTVSSEAL